MDKETTTDLATSRQSAKGIFYKQSVNKKKRYRYPFLFSHSTWGPV